LIRPHRARRGVTLVEIALAVAILATMATLIAGSLGRSFEAQDTVREIDARYHNIRVAMNRMVREVSLAFLTTNDRHGVERIWMTAFKLEDRSDFDRLYFTSFAHQILRANAKESDQCEIEYFGETDDEDSSKMNLMRREDPRIDAEPDKGGRNYVLAEHITKFQVRVFDERLQDWTDEWDTEKPDYAGRLPTVVEIRMEILDENDKPLSFVTKTRINLPRALGVI